MVIPLLHYGEPPSPRCPSFQEGAGRRLGRTFRVLKLPRIDYDAALHGMGYKNRASAITKTVMREMLQIKKLMQKMAQIYR